MSDFQQPNETFVTDLENVCRDRGHRAALRRWWSKGTRHYALPILGLLAALDKKPRTVLAALHATHTSDLSPAHRLGGNSVGEAALALAGGKKGFGSMERHFRRLLACDDLDDLAAQLNRLAKRLERQAIALDYARLLADLQGFIRNPQQVKTRWAIDFWQASVPADPNLSTDPDSTDSAE